MCRAIHVHVDEGGIRDQRKFFTHTTTNRSIQRSHFVQGSRAEIQQTVVAPDKNREYQTGVL